MRTFVFTSQSGPQTPTEGITSPAGFTEGMPWACVLLTVQKYGGKTSIWANVNAITPERDQLGRILKDTKNHEGFYNFEFVSLGAFLP
jgi:hypothetical protein